MASIFSEFSKTYDNFIEEFPNHPLIDELRARIIRGRFPNEQWLESRIKKMNDLMEPTWLKSCRLSPEKECA